MSDHSLDDSKVNHEERRNAVRGEKVKLSLVRDGGKRRVVDGTDGSDPRSFSPWV